MTLFPPPFTGEVDAAKPRTEGEVRQGEELSRHFAKRLRSQMTEAEVILWTFVRKKQLKGFRFRRQHPIGPYVADFACISGGLVVEVDGATHRTPEQLNHDAQRTSFLRREGWRVVRVTNRDVYENMDGVWRLIAEAMPPPSAASRRPPPP